MDEARQLKRRRTTDERDMPEFTAKTILHAVSDTPEKEVAKCDYTPEQEMYFEAILKGLTEETVYSPIFPCQEQWYRNDQNARQKLASNERMIFGR